MWSEHASVFRERGVVMSKGVWSAKVDVAK